MGATVPTRGGEDIPFLCDQQKGGGEGGLRGVHKAVQVGPDEVRGRSADDCHEFETEETT